MAVVNKKASFAAKVTKTEEAPSNSEVAKKKAKFYINVGIYLPNKETGEMEFVQLPFGLAIDTMSFKNPTGNSEFAKKLREQDDLLRKTLAYFETFKPGDAVIMEDGVCEFRMINEATELEEGETNRLEGFSWK